MTTEKHKQDFVGIFYTVYKQYNYRSDTVCVKWKYDMNDIRLYHIMPSRKINKYTNL